MLTYGSYNAICRNYSKYSGNTSLYAARSIDAIPRPLLQPRDRRPYRHNADTPLVVTPNGRFPPFPFNRGDDRVTTPSEPSAQPGYATTSVPSHSIQRRTTGDLSNPDHPLPQARYVAREVYTVCNRLRRHRKISANDNS